jgi:DNA topoisomerase-1
MDTETKNAPITLNRRKLKSLLHDSEKCAEAINLVYVTDQQPGISRVKHGKGFTYMMDGKEITDADTQARIKSLVLPPAWEQVWICPLANGHLQATGTDKLNRKQYQYHPLWNTLRNQTKFFHLQDFGKALPNMRERLNADMKLPGLPLNKVLATVVSLMEDTGIRVGNSMYEKLYGTFGVTTLKDKHVAIKGSQMTFSFKGKKGVYHNIKLKSKRLSTIVKQCRDIPGKELFQYYDEDGKRHSIDSGMVNAYIKEVCGESFTSKDFRTWTGTLCALETFSALEYCDTITETKKKVVETLDVVAAHLGNTRSVCKKYYVHPVVVDHYTNKTLDRYVCKSPDTDGCYSIGEQTLMRILDDIKVAVIAA